MEFANDGFTASLCGAQKACVITNNHTETVTHPRHWVM
jgi:hypothetical protein